MSKTNKFLALCAAFVGLGIILYITGFFLGESVTGIGISNDGFQVYSWNQTKLNETDFIEMTDIELDAFQNIDMKVSYANVEIKESDRFKISYKTAQNHPLSYEIKDGTLHITQASNPAGSSSFHYMFLGFSGIQSGDIRESESVTVYIPENVELNSISVNNDCGNTNLSSINASSVSVSEDYGDVNLTDMNAPCIALEVNTGYLNLDNIIADTLTVTTDYGNVTLNTIDASTAALKVNTGNVNLDSIVADTLTVTADYGDVGLSTINASSVTLKMNTGNVNIRDIDSGIIETAIDYGDLQLSSAETDSLSVEINTGSLEITDMTANTFAADIEYGETNAERITISGDADITIGTGSLHMKDASLQTLTADNEYGNVSLEFSSPATDYSYDLFTEYGTIKVEGQDMGEKYKPLSSSDIGKHITVSCESGNIDIKGL